MRIVLREQSSVGVRALAGEPGLLARPDAEALLAMADRMGARVASWESPTALRVHQFVGGVRAGDLEIEILPKIGSEGDASRVRRHLLHMLLIAEDVTVTESELVGFLKSDAPLLRVLALLYCRRLAEALRRGLRQDYVVSEEALPRIRGKVRWAAQACRTARLEFECTFDERSEDTPLNRTLKAALRRARTMLDDARDRGSAELLQHALAGVSDTAPSLEQLARLRTDRLNHHLEPVLALARLVLIDRSPDLAGRLVGDHRSCALVWDMNVLFERFVGRVLQRSFAEDWTVKLQDASRCLASHADGRGAFPLVPDILLSGRRGDVVVADTKWKALDPGDATLGVAGADAYQLVAYARTYEASLAVLVYPHHGAAAPGLQREFRVAGGHGPLRLRIVTVDLARPDDVEGHLRAGLLAA